MIKLNLGVSFIRLKNGDDIVAEVVGASGGAATLRRPCKIMALPSDNDGMLRLAFYEWVPSMMAEYEDITIDQEFILLQTQPTKDVLENYEKVMLSYHEPVQMSFTEEMEELFQMEPTKKRETLN